MKDRIELLMRLGLSEEQALAFIKNVAEEAYEGGFGDCDSFFKGETSLNFQTWWDSNFD